MKIVHIITRLILGGAQENTLYNCEDLVRDFGDDVILVTGPAEGPEGDLFERAKRSLEVRLVPELCRAVKPWTDRNAYRKLLAMLRVDRPDVVHTHSSKAGILGRLAAWGAKVPAVIHSIHGLPFHPSEKWWKNQLYIAAERYASKRCHKIITVADAMIDQAVAVGIAPRPMFQTIYSGMEVDTSLHDPQNRADIRREFGLPAEAIVATKVARLFEFKGHDDVITAADRLFKTASRAANDGLGRLHFLFVGGGIWRDRLEAKVKAAGLVDRFHFAGLVPSTRIPELLHASDLVVHASYREGLARVLPQGLLAGKPVISYDVDGAREVVITGQTGTLVRFGDLDGLAAAIADLVADSAKRSAYGNAGRDLCRERFDHHLMTRAIRTVYTDVLAHADARST